MNDFKKVLSLAALLSAALLNAESVVTCFSMRSVSENAARQMAGLANHVNKYSPDKCYVCFSVTPEYTRSCRDNRITRALFGCDVGDYDCINISGSNATKRSDATKKNTDKDWLADYFYLPRDYQASLCFDPHIKNFLADFNLYLGLDVLADGLFFRVHTPIVKTEWALDACETVSVQGTQPGFIDALLPGNTLRNFLSYSCNQKAPKAFVEGEINVTTEALKCSKICGCDITRKRTRFAEVQADLGYNFLDEEDIHCGIFVRGAAPTGNRPLGEFLFEPIVGNGHHWEFGGGLTAHAIIWRDEQANKHSGFYFEADVTHLFRTWQVRDFDLKNNGPLSRYLLAQKIVDLTHVVFTPVANLSSSNVIVSIPVQADIVFMFNYTSGNFGFDIGYNFWGRSCEKFHCEDCCDNCTIICGCGSRTDQLDGNTWFLAGRDQILSTYKISGKSFNQNTIHALGEADDTNVFLTKEDRNLNGGRTRGISHKVFGHFSYNGMDKENWTPFLGFGGEIELGKVHAACSECCTQPANCPPACNTSCCTNACDGCKDCALSQWGIWLKGGVAF